MTLIPKKRVKSVRVTNKEAIDFINDKAARDFRSASSTAALVIVEHLSKNVNDNAGTEQEKFEAAK